MFTRILFSSRSFYRNFSSYNRDYISDPMSRYEKLYINGIAFSGVAGSLISGYVGSQESNKNTAEKFQNIAGGCTLGAFAGLAVGCLSPILIVVLPCVGGVYLCDKFINKDIQEKDIVIAHKNN